MKEFFCPALKLGPQKALRIAGPHPLSENGTPAADLIFHEAPSGIRQNKIASLSYIADCRT
jgi:hypothetical protein